MRDKNTPSGQNAQLLMLTLEVHKTYQALRPESHDMNDINSTIIVDFTVGKPRI